MLCWLELTCTLDLFQLWGCVASVLKQIFSAAFCSPGVSSHFLVSCMQIAVAWLQDLLAALFHLSSFSPSSNLVSTLLSLLYSFPVASLLNSKLIMLYCLTKSGPRDYSLVMEIWNYFFIHFYLYKPDITKYEMHISILKIILYICGLHADYTINWIILIIIRSLI